MSDQKERLSKEEIREAADAFEKKLTEMMEEPIRMYNSPAANTELDLVAAVRELLVDSGCAAVLPEAFDNSRFIREAHGKVAHAQQFNLIRWASLQLLSCEASNPVARYAMPYELAPTDWLEVFREYVLPQMLSHGLPVKIGD